MISLTALLKKVEDIRSIGSKLGFDVEVDSQCILFNHEGKTFVRVFPSSDEIKNITSGIVFADDEQFSQSGKFLTPQMVEKLLEIKKVVSDNTIWYAILDMVFNTITVNPLVAVETIEVLLKINETKEEIPQTIVTPSHSRKPVATKKVTHDTDDVITSIQEYLKTNELVSQGKKFYCDSNLGIGVLLLMSKTYIHSKKGPDFWFGYRPYQKMMLENYKTSYIAFYLPEEGDVIVLPSQYVNSKLDQLHATYNGEELQHWHIRLDKYNGKYLFRIPNKGREDINEYSLKGFDKESERQTAEIESCNVIKITSGKFRTIKKK